MIFLPSVFFFCDVIAKFLIIPVNELDKMIIEGIAGRSIKHRGISVTVKFSGDNWVFYVSQYVLQGAL